jgi:signal transduction histidine kinase
MEKIKQLSFQAHAHIKSVVGQDMINDDNIAVKELIKNGMDANATEVRVTFRNTLEKSNDGAIIIYDNGDGMSIDDIEQKWLNMAFSSKKNDGQRKYAGSKGIGRFSADRLGSILHLYTKKKDEEDIIKLDINWGEFEDIPEWSTKINDITFSLSRLTDKDFFEETTIEGFESGTVLKIRSPRYFWSVEHIKRLRKDLEKFMIPKQVEIDEHFKLFLHIEGYKEQNELSGEIKNEVFDKLPFKTSHIVSSIDEKGEQINTEIFYQGELLFGMKEKNKFHRLKNVSITLFYLNSYHKAFFKRRTGLRSTVYGSIFLYLNGFRVPPYGENENDWLGVDRRHAQGHRRHLGLRDLIGRIELKDDSGKDYEVTSDREGIKRNEAFEQLQDNATGFFGHVLKKLEMFVVKALQWDSSTEDSRDIEKRVEDIGTHFDQFDTAYAMSNEEKEKSISSLLEKIILNGSRLDDIKVIKLGKQCMSILSQQHEEGLERLKNRFDKLGIREELAFLLEDKKKIQQEKRAIELKLRDSQKKVTILSQDLVAETHKKETIAQELQVSEKRRHFAETHMDTKNERLLALIHHVSIWSTDIGIELRNILGDLVDINESTISKEAIESIISKIQRVTMVNDQVIKLSDIITKMGFDLSRAETVKLDIFSYIEEYIDAMKKRAWGKSYYKLEKIFSNPARESLEITMKPVAISMLVDNIMDNAQKHDADRIEMSIERKDRRLRLTFRDNGNGLSDTYRPDQLFHAGITTTEGAGIGLYQVKTAAEEHGARISIESNSPKGICVILEWDDEA